MKFLLLLQLIFMSLGSFPVWGKTSADGVDHDRYKNIYYIKGTDVPFTGELEGWRNGKVESGKPIGLWIYYHDNGSLMSKEHYNKYGRLHGPYVSYKPNGQLGLKSEYKSGKRIGLWVSYHDNGQILDKGNYTDYGVKTGTWVRYYKNGELTWKGEYVRGQMEGCWVHYKTDGSMYKPGSGTFENGEKVKEYSFFSCF